MNQTKALGRLAAGVLLGAFLPMGYASFSPIIYDTGVDTSGNSLSGGAVDPHYKLDGGDAYVVNDGWPVEVGIWLTYGPSNGNSRWISVNSSGGGGFENTYTFSTTFSLPFTPTIASLSGLFSSDNDSKVYLNQQDDAHLIGSTGVTQFKDYWSFGTTDSALFKKGDNTLYFVVHNGYLPPEPGVDAGPFGLRVQDVALTVVPEPSTYLAGLGALAMLGVFQWRTRN